MGAIAKEKVDRVARLAAGSALLLPALLAFGFALWGPGLRTLVLSLYTAALGRPAQFVGLANYVQLLADPAFGLALGRSLLVALVRVAALALPTGVAWLWGRRPAESRLAARLALGVPAALSAPVALGLLWRLAGQQVPWLYGLDLAHPARALPSYLALEAMASLGLGGPLAACALLLARTRRARRGVLVLAALAAVASGLDSFTLAFAATGGGPYGATRTLPLYAFRTAFLGLDLGASAAQAGLLAAACVALGLAFAWLSDRLYLRLVPVGKAGTDEQGTPRREADFRSLGDFGSLPHGSLPRLGVLGDARLRHALFCAAGDLALALYAAPFLLAYLWSAGQAFRPGGQPLVQATYDLLLGLSLLNGTIAPLVTTLVVGLPAAYLAALSLSLLRPFGRRGSRAAYLLFMAGGFVPQVAVAIGLYDAVRATGVYNTPVAPCLPFLASATSLFILKLYFDGRAPLLEKASRAGQPAVAAFFELAFRPSLRVAILAAAVSLLLAGQSLVWPLAMVAQRDYMTLSLRLAVLQNGLAGAPGALGAGCWLVLTVWGLATFIVWWLVQSLVVSRFELVAAEPDA